MEDPKSPQLSTSEAENSSLDSDCSEEEEEVKSQTFLQEPPKPKQKRVKRPPDPTDPVVIAAAAAAASAAAEAEEAARLEAEKASKMSSLENLKYYTSLFLGTLCIVNVFAFLFLVPFVLDPAISTLRHKFVNSAVTCKVTNVSVKQGKTNCLWSSCREGCTSDMFQCYQVRVQYVDEGYREDAYVNEYLDADWKNLSRFDTLEVETRFDTPLLVNIKGCGYPPEISCPAFANRYNEIMAFGKTFPCYYSRENPWIVLQEYSYEDTVNSIVASIMIPNVIFAVSLVILLYWYCPYCQARCKKYEDQIDAEDKESITVRGGRSKRF